MSDSLMIAWIGIFTTLVGIVVGFFVPEVRSFLRLKPPKERTPKSVQDIPKISTQKSVKVWRVIVQKIGLKHISIFLTIIGIIISLFAPEVRHFLGIGTNSTDGRYVTSFEENTKIDSLGVTILGWLYVYPEDIGPFRGAPTNSIAGINNQKMYGYNNWRLPSIDELDMLRINASKLNNLSNNYYLGYVLHHKEVKSWRYGSGTYVSYNLKNRKINQKVYDIDIHSTQLKGDVYVRLVRTE